MADHTAIAGVSRSLRTLLRDRMAAPVSVTLAPPDVTVAGINDARVNLYLFHVGENAELRNQDLPGRGHPGRYGRPPLSLNLRYLLTCHGATEDQEESDLNAQIVLGDAMRALHDHALITEDLTIGRPAAGTVGDPILDLGLRGQVERVKVTLVPSGLEEMSKLWSTIHDVNFRRSVIYEATAIQIESLAERRAAPPVAVRRIFVSTRSRPEIAAAYHEPVPGDPPRDARVRPGETVVIEGRNFMADRTFVRFGELEPIRVVPAAAERIEIAVPDDEYPADLDNPAPRPIAAADRLQPGPLLVQVLTEHGAEGVEGALDRGVPISEPRSFRSNQVVLELVPTVTGIDPADGTAAGLLRVDGERLWDPDLVSYVIVGDVPIEVREPGVGDAWAAPSATSVQVPLAALADALPTPPPAGRSYGVAVQVNGARNRTDGTTFLLRP
ncbi:MAG: DUF4255 domain-containing protein [Alphaproteobacteria bacterium]